MKASSLPNLRGLIGNANRVKIELAKAINAAMVYAKRGSGYSPAADGIETLLQAARDENRLWRRADSIDATPATVTKAAAQTQQITTKATWDDGVEVDVSADPRVTYSTSDAEKATVSSTGLITAVATGSATITVTFHGRTDTIAVTVS